MWECLDLLWDETAGIFCDMVSVASAEFGGVMRTVRALCENNYYNSHFVNFFPYRDALSQLNPNFTRTCYNLTRSLPELVTT